MSESEDRAAAMFAAKRKRLGEERWAQLVQQVEHRLTDHLLQAPTDDVAGANGAGASDYFGALHGGRIPEEPPWAEAKYTIMSTVGERGVVREMNVMLRVWADWPCYLAIQYNRSMVARVCADRRLSFGTRAQTDVQTRVVIMWLRLHGQFFWTEPQKLNSGNLYFDTDEFILRQIHSDSFRAWLHELTRINPARSEFDYLARALDAAAMSEEVSRGCTPSSLFARAGDSVYISSGDAAMYRVSPAKDGEPVVEYVRNGTDGVVFRAGDTLAEWDYQSGEGVDPFEATPPFSSANYQSPSGRMIARLWTLGLFAGLRSYPAIVFTGKMRSGKSRTAKALFELLGAPVRLSAIRERGEQDFWTVLNKGGVVCFDNVDTRNSWFGDAMQLACTDGSTEVRTLYSNDETTRLYANAKIVLTSNNPLFASESGLADRLQIVRLEQFDGTQESSDSALSAAIQRDREQALTFFARTVSRALSDRESVESNVNLRHPDFAVFALRCARAISGQCYSDAIRALRSAEFDKAVLTLQSNQTTSLIVEALDVRFAGGGEAFCGTASALLELIVACHPDLANSRFVTATTVGRALSKYREQLARLYQFDHRRYGSQERYDIKGFSDEYAKNKGVSVDNARETEDSQSVDEILGL